MKQKIDSRRKWFGELKITSDQTPDEIIDFLYSQILADRDNNAWEEAHGLLLGFPESAVKFYSSIKDEEKSTGNSVDSDIVSVHVFSSATTQRGAEFVYRIPFNSSHLPENQSVQDKAHFAFEQYKIRRELFNGDSLQIIRSWYDDGHGNCSPSKAVDKVIQPIANGPFVWRW